jgi:hypothetical protein
MILPISKFKRVNHNGTTGTTKIDGGIKPLFAIVSVVPSWFYFQGAEDTCVWFKPLVTRNTSVTRAGRRVQLSL